MPLSEFPGVKTPPKYKAQFLRFLNPVLDALREKGGEARPPQIYEAIAQNLSLSEEERTVTNKNGYPKFENQIAFARSYLFKTGYLDSPSWGIWRLTEKGKEAHLDGPDIDSIWLRVTELNALAKAGTPEHEPSTKEEEEAIAPSPQTSPYSDHRPALVTLIGGMTRHGFEKFCSELLARVEVEDVQTTRYSKDGGVDGTGRLRINEFVSQPIAFQAKKFDE